MVETARQCVPGVDDAIAAAIDRKDNPVCHPGFPQPCCVWFSVMRAGYVVFVRICMVAGCDVQVVLLSMFVVRCILLLNCRQMLQ